MSKISPLRDESLRALSITGKRTIDFQKYTSIKIGATFSVHTIMPKNLASLSPFALADADADSGVEALGEGAQSKLVQLKDIESKLIKPKDIERELIESKVIQLKGVEREPIQLEGIEREDTERKDAPPSYIVGGGSNLLIGPAKKQLYILDERLCYIHALGASHAAQAPSSIQAALFEQASPTQTQPLEQASPTTQITPMKSTKSTQPPEPHTISQTTDRVYLEVGAATPSRALFVYAKRHDLGGCEFLASLPGQIGGASFMNAGLKGHEVSSIIEALNIDGVWVGKEALRFGYRKSFVKGIIYALRIGLDRGYDKEATARFKALRSNQPSGASCGSCFANPDPAELRLARLDSTAPFAGALIEAIGLKGGYFVDGRLVEHGAGLRGAHFSPQHANFLKNNGNASFEDAISLIELAKARVLERFFLRLRSEVAIIP